MEHGKLCRFLPTGSCDRGDRCGFAHTLAALCKPKWSTVESDWPGWPDGKQPLTAVFRTYIKRWVNQRMGLPEEIAKLVHHKPTVDNIDRDIWLRVHGDPTGATTSSSGAGVSSSSPGGGVSSSSPWPGASTSGVSAQPIAATSAPIALPDAPTRRWSNPAGGAVTYPEVPRDPDGTVSFKAPPPGAPTAELLELKKARERILGRPDPPPVPSDPGSATVSATTVSAAPPSVVSAQPSPSAATTGAAPPSMVSAQPSVSSAPPQPSSSTATTVSAAPPQPTTESAAPPQPTTTVSAAPPQPTTVSASPGKALAWGPTETIQLGTAVQQEDSGSNSSFVSITQDTPQVSTEPAPVAGVTPEEAQDRTTGKTKHRCPKPQAHVEESVSAAVPVSTADVSSPVDVAKPVSAAVPVSTADVTSRVDVEELVSAAVPASTADVASSVDVEKPVSAAVPVSTADVTSPVDVEKPVSAAVPVSTALVPVSAPSDTSSSSSCRSVPPPYRGPTIHYWLPGGKCKTWPGVSATEPAAQPSAASETSPGVSATEPAAQPSAASETSPGVSATAPAESEQPPAPSHPPPVSVLRWLSRYQ